MKTTIIICLFVLVWSYKSADINGESLDHFSETELKLSGNSLRKYLENEQSANEELSQSLDVLIQQYIDANLKSCLKEVQNLLKAVANLVTCLKKHK